MRAYKSENKTIAKQLRKNMTPWERKLWYEYLRTYPVRFQRQKMIDQYIVDFYCAKAGLCVEMDGGGHYKPEQQEKDAKRTTQLQSYNLQVLRISNDDVDHNFEGVCQVIDQMVKKNIKR